MLVKSWFFRIFLLMLACLVIIFLSIHQVQQANRKTENRDLHKVLSLMADNKYSEARHLIDKWRNGRYIAQRAEMWLRCDLDCSIAVRDLARILVLAAERPALFNSNETRAYWLARALLKFRQFHKLDRLREHWSGKTREKRLWLSIEADLLVARGRRIRAIRLLDGVKLEGRLDCGRLIRLAALTAATDPEKSWKCLSDAVKIAGDNPELRLFRGEFLEAAKSFGAAEFEYRKALEYGTNNPLYRLRLGQFLERRHAYTRYSEFYRSFRWDSLSRTERNHVLFWRLVVTGNKVTLPSCTDDMDHVERLLREFPYGNSSWSDSVEDEIRKEDETLRWLWILAALSTGDKRKNVFELLRRGSCKWSMAPQLARLLVSIESIAFTARGKKVTPDPGFAPIVTESSHPLLKLAAKRIFSISRNLENEGESTLFLSPAIWSAACLAVGWREAALRLYIPGTGRRMPQWFSYGMVQAARINRGTAAALDLLKHFRDTRLLKLLKAELSIQSGNIAKGRKLLSKLVAGDDEVSFRASMLCAFDALKQGDFGHARSLLEGNRELSQSREGSFIRELIEQRSRG